MASIKGLDSFDFDSFLHPPHESNEFSDFARMSSCSGGIMQLPTQTHLPMDTIRARAEDVAMAYMKVIVKIHRSAPGDAVFEYPQRMQNLLLALSRTIEYIGKYLGKCTENGKEEFPDKLQALDLDLVKCELICEQILEDCPVLDLEKVGLDQTIAMWKSFVSHHERTVHQATVTLLTYCKHTKW